MTRSDSYATATQVDQRRNFELDLQSRKFDPVKEQPDDFLTDLHRLPT